jgi:hypothetical protein
MDEQILTELDSLTSFYHCLTQAGRVHSADHAAALANLTEMIERRVAKLAAADREQEEAPAKTA